MLIATLGFNALASFQVNLAIQSSLLMIVAWFLSRLLRKRSADVQARVWILTLLALTILPIANWSASNFGWTTLSPVTATHRSQSLASKTHPLDSPSDHFNEANDASSVERSRPKELQSHRATRSATFDERLEERPLPTDSQQTTTELYEAASTINDQHVPSDQSDAGSASVEITGSKVAPELDGKAGSELVQADSSRSIGRLINQAMFIAALVWLAGFVLSLLRILRSISKAKQVSQSAVPIRDGPLVELLQRTRRELAVGRQVNLAIADSDLAPSLVGFFQPTLIISPEIKDWSNETTGSVFIHELAHVKRCDLAWRLFAQIATAAYWWHPLSRTIYRRLCIAQEQACDDCVLNSGTRPELYAEILVKLLRAAKTTPPQPVLSMANPLAMEQRIQSILAPERERRMINRKTSITLALIAVGLTTGVVTLQVLRADPSAVLNDDAAGAEVQSSFEIDRELLTFRDEGFGFWRNVVLTELDMDKAGDSLDAMKAFAECGYRKEAVQTLQQVSRRNMMLQSSWMNTLSEIGGIEAFDLLMEDDSNQIVATTVGFLAENLRPERMKESTAKRLIAIGDEHGGAVRLDCIQIFGRTRTNDAREETIAAFSKWYREGDLLTKSHVADASWYLGIEDKELVEELRNFVGLEFSELRAMALSEDRANWWNDVRHISGYHSEYQQLGPYHYASQYNHATLAFDHSVRALVRIADGESIEALEKAGHLLETAIIEASTPFTKMDEFLREKLCTAIESGIQGHKEKAYVDQYFKEFRE